MTQVILINKPFNVLCQFSPHENKDTLKKFVDIKDYYPCGRLDYDSEGLLVLSNNGSLQALIAEPKHKMKKTYWVQIEGQISDDSLNELRTGVIIKGEKTKPAQAKRIDEPADLWERAPPIRERKNIPTTWIELCISEGKNRQVRKMTAAVGHPTLRLIRHSIGEWCLGTLAPGEWCYANLSDQTEQRLNKRVASKSRKAQQTNRRRPATRKRK